jgi:hypothetical protein
MISSMVHSWRLLDSNNIDESVASSLSATVFPLRRGGGGASTQLLSLLINFLKTEGFLLPVSDIKCSLFSYFLLKLAISFFLMHLKSIKCKFVFSALRQHGYSNKMSIFRKVTLVRPQAGDQGSTLLHELFVAVVWSRVQCGFENSNSIIQQGGCGRQ